MRACIRVRSVVTCRTSPRAARALLFAFVASLVMATNGVARAADDKEKDSGLVLVPLLAPKAPAVDGRLSEEGWSNAAGITRLHVAGAPSQPPSRATEVYVTQDTDNLFVAFRCGEPYPERRKNTARGRSLESIGGDDSVVVQLAPGDDSTSTYYELIVSSGGAVSLLQHGAKTKSWNAGGIQAATRDGLGGWVAEIRVPFKALDRGTPGPGERWRVNFARHIATVDPDEWATWAPMPGPSVEQRDRFAEIRFE